MHKTRIQTKSSVIICRYNNVKYTFVKKNDNVKRYRSFKSGGLDIRASIETDVRVILRQVPKLHPSSPQQTLHMPSVCGPHAYNGSPSCPSHLARSSNAFLINSLQI